jgi:hypothetical protein
MALLVGDATVAFGVVEHVDYQPEVFVCVCACVRACVCVYVRACVYQQLWMACRLTRSAVMPSGCARGLFFQHGRVS